MWYMRSFEELMWNSCGTHADHRMHMTWETPAAPPETRGPLGELRWGGGARGQIDLISDRLKLRVYCTAQSLWVNVIHVV